uniref:Uncharacterized protein n=1 Tax=Phytophthora ramorum TaxID=164328 RepID=H3GJA2_PHYRM
MLFGVDVSPPPRTFPVSPSKFKIFIGFFQIFGNFQSSFVVKWSSGIQNVMDFSQKFNLDLVAIAGIDCVVTKNFYFDFTVTVTLVVFALMIITAYFYAVRSNLRVWQARVKLRMNYLTYRNKCLKLYCWMALFLYPSVSKTILTVYNCQEVGDVFYLVADRRLVCYHGQWALFGVVATIGVVVWVVGIPFFFGVLIWLAQDRGVAARLKLLRKPHMRAQLHKWLKEVEEQQVADGRFVRHMDSLEVQDEELAKTPLCKRDSDLFTLNPYDGYSDNLIASITQLQLFFTLWLGVMIRLNGLNTESLINVQLLSFVLVGTCIAVTIFGLSMIVAEGLSESQRIFTETKAQRKKQVQDEVRKCWFKAYNYAAYEAQMVRYGGQLSLKRSWQVKILSMPA